MFENPTSILFKVLAVGSGFALSFFEPIWPYLLVMITLVFCDVITGVRAAKKRGEVIKSKSLRATVLKITYYFMAVFLSRGFELVYFQGTWVENFIPLSYMVAGFISAIEFQSNIENIGDITGIDIWGRIKSKMDNFLKSK